MQSSRIRKLVHLMSLTPFKNHELAFQELTTAPSDIDGVDFVIRGNSSLVDLINADKGYPSSASIRFVTPFDLFYGEATVNEISQLIKAAKNTSGDQFKGKWESVTSRVPYFKKAGSDIKFRISATQASNFRIGFIPYSPTEITTTQSQVTNVAIPENNSGIATSERLISSKFKEKNETPIMVEVTTYVKYPYSNKKSWVGGINKGSVARRKKYFKKSYRRFYRKRKGGYKRYRKTFRKFYR